MTEEINPLLKEIFENTPIVTKHYTIEMWLENEHIKAINEVLNNVTYFDLDGYHLVCAECGEVLTND